MNIIECYTIKLLCQRSVLPGFLKPLHTTHENMGCENNFELN